MNAKTSLAHLALVGVLALSSALAPVPAESQSTVQSFEARPGTVVPALEDVFTINGLGGLDLSADGAHLLYTRTRTELEENRNRTQVWRVATDGGTPVQMTRGEESASSPQWHPEGDRFAFLSSRGASGSGSGAALHLMPAFGGEAELLYRHPTSISAFLWSPDGSRVAFVAQDEVPEEEEARRREGRDVRLDDDPGRYTHLWLLDVERREARRLTSGSELTVQGGVAWSPDGGLLAFRGAPSPLITESWAGTLYTVEAGRDGETEAAAVGDAAAGLEATEEAAAHEAGEGAEPLPTPTRISPEGVVNGGAAWEPDGRHLVYQGRLTPERRLGYTRVLRVPAGGGGEPEDITPDGDLAPSTFVFPPDGRGAFFESVTGTSRGLFFIPAGSREAVRLTPEEGLYAGSAFSADGRRVAFLHQSPERPVEIHTAELAATPGAGTVRAEAALTGHNAHAEEWALARTEVIRWESVDGLEIEGLLVLPAGWSPEDGPRALVTNIHGGPSGVWTQNFQAGSGGSVGQLFANAGYAYFLPNPRGSTGYGDDFQRMVIEDWGGLDFQDIMTGIDHLVERGVAHPDSLGVKGWSYGGYMTAWAVTQTDRFRAAIVGAGITESISMWGTQDIVHVFEDYFGGGPYEPERWDVYQRSSPMAFVDRASTPTLLIHGENDPRVPPNQAQIFHRALRANGVPSELLWLPRTGHGPSEPGLQYERARAWMEWMDRWIRERPPQVSARLR